MEWWFTVALAQAITGMNLLLGCFTTSAAIHFRMCCYWKVISFMAATLTPLHHTTPRWCWSFSSNSILGSVFPSRQQLKPWWTDSLYWINNRVRFYSENSKCLYVIVLIIKRLFPFCLRETTCSSWTSLRFPNKIISSRDPTSFPAVLPPDP